MPGRRVVHVCLGRQQGGRQAGYHVDRRVRARGPAPSTPKRVITTPSLRDRKNCCRLRLRQHGIVTQALCNRARRRRLVGGQGVCRRKEMRVNIHINAHGEAQKQTRAGKRGTLGKWASYRACWIPFDPITSRRYGSEVHTCSPPPSALRPYLYPRAILGHAPPPPLLCPAPACLNFPYLCCQ